MYFPLPFPVPGSCCAPRAGCAVEVGAARLHHRPPPPGWEGWVPPMLLPANLQPLLLCREGAQQGCGCPGSDASPPAFLACIPRKPLPPVTEILPVRGRMAHICVPPCQPGRSASAASNGSLMGLSSNRDPLWVLALWATTVGLIWGVGVGLLPPSSWVLQGSEFVAVTGVTPLCFSLEDFSQQWSPI